MSGISSNKKIGIALICVGIVAGIGVSIYTTRSMTKKPPAKVASQNVSQTKDVVQTNPLDGKTPSTASKPSMDSTSVLQYENEARNDFRKFDFAGGLKVLEPAVQGYNLQSGQATVLNDLNYDGSLLANINTNPQESATTDGSINIVNGLKDPEDVLLGFLMLDEPSREKVALSGDCISPIMSSKVITVLNTGTDTGSLFDHVKLVHPSTKTLYKISFIVDSYTLDAYVIENADGSLQMYTIIDPTNSSIYYTTGQWQQIEQNMASGKPAMDGVSLNKSSTVAPQSTGTPSSAGTASSGASSSQSN